MRKVIPTAVWANVSGGFGLYTRVWEGLEGFFHRLAVAVVAHGPVALYVYMYLYIYSKEISNNYLPYK